MARYLSETYTVHTYEIDCQSRLTIPALVGFSQEIAYKHSNSLEAGFEHLFKQNCFWVLSRFYLEIKRMPKWGESFVVKTWYKGYDGFLVLRDYTLHSTEGEYFGAACSAWLVVDISTRRIQRADKICAGVEAATENALDKKLGKIKLHEPFLPAGEIIPRYSHIDMNNHVNNVNYFKWAIDYLPFDKTNRKIRTFEINFLSEAKQNEIIDISYCRENEYTWQCMWKNKTTNLEHARAIIQLEKE